MEDRARPRRPDRSGREQTSNHADRAGGIANGRESSASFAPIGAADNGPQVHGFTGAIDAAIGVDERFVARAEVSGSAGRFRFAEIKLAGTQIQPGQVATN